jgi:hypothetical protein
MSIIAYGSHIQSDMQGKDQNGSGEQHPHKIQVIHVFFIFYILGALIDLSFFYLATSSRCYTTLVDEVVPDSFDGAATRSMKRTRQIGVVSNLAQVIEIDLDSNPPKKKVRIRQKRLVNSKQ